MSDEIEKPIKKIINDVANPKAIVIFAHGAGANMHHEFMEEITELLTHEKVSVIRFNFPYMDKRAETGKRYPPDRMPKLLHCFEQVLSECIATHAQTKGKSLPIFIGGKSMGSRVAATLAGDEKWAAHIHGVFCLGYPFHPTKKPEKLRLEPLQQIKVPTLIVQGERDTLGNKTEINSYELSPLCKCYFLDDGDHSLKPRVKSGFTYQQHKQAAVSLLLAFMCKARVLYAKTP